MERARTIRVHAIRARSDVGQCNWLVIEGRGEANGVDGKSYE